MKVPPRIPIRDGTEGRKATVVCIVAILFSLQVLAAGLLGPIFSDMFLDFGPKIPALTRGVMTSHYLWTLSGVGGIVWSIILFVRGRKNYPAVRRTALTLAVSTFILGQTLTVALFLPVFQMSAVVSEDDGAQNS